MTPGAVEPPFPQGSLPDPRALTPINAATSDAVGRAGRLMASLSLPPTSLTRITHANLNDVFLCGDHLVMRMARAADLAGAAGRLGRETMLLRQLHGRLPVAEVIAHGRFEGHEFQLQRRIAGQPLLFGWSGMTGAARDSSVSRILDWLDVMQRVTFGAFGRIGGSEPQFASWSEFYRADIASLMDRLPDAATAELGPHLLEDIVGFTRAHLATIDPGQPACLVHNDLWPANILAHDGAASHLLDFELALAGVAEADLFMLEYFCRKPEEFGHPGHYADLWERLMWQRPALVAMPNIGRRFDVYDIRFTLARWLRTGDFLPGAIATMRADLEEIIGGKFERRL